MVLVIAVDILCMALGHGALAVTNYMLPVILLLRNDSLWPETFVFISAVAASAPVAYLWLCVTLVLAGMLTVLLHGQYVTGDYYTDNQFEDFFTSISTISVYMIGEYI